MLRTDSSALSVIQGLISIIVTLKRLKTEMKLSVTLSAVGYVSCQDRTCYWTGTSSGNFLECLPEYYIKGACESDIW